MSGMAVWSILVGIGIGIGIGIQNDLFYVVLRSIPFTDVINTRSTKRALPFLLSQNSAGKLNDDGDGRPSGKVTEAWIRIKVKQPGGRLVYEGWPEFYGSGSEQSEVYLSPACQVDLHSPPPDVVTKIKGPGVLIYERDIESVEFMDRAESPCYELWFPPKTTAAP
jgi:hypothetical protein